MKTTGRATFLKLKDSVTKVKQQAQVLSMINKLRSDRDSSRLSNHAPPLRGLNSISVDNDFIDMSMSNIITAMHPFRRANMDIYKKHNPNIDFESIIEEEKRKARKKKNPGLYLREAIAKQNRKDNKKADNLPGKGRSATVAPPIRPS